MRDNMRDNRMENLEIRRRKPEKSAAESVRMMVSGCLTKDNQKIVRVSFFRENGYADGVLPDAKIEKYEGFNEGEIRMLEEYLRQNSADIYAQAKQVNPMRNLFT